MGIAMESREKPPVISSGPKNRLRKLVSVKTMMAAGILLAGLGCSALLVLTNSAQLAQTPVEKARSIATTTIQIETLSPNLPLFGRVSTPHKAQLTAAVSGEIRSIAVADGQWVENASLLIQLDDRDARLELLQYQATAEQARAQLEFLQSSHSADKKMLQQQRELFQMAQKKLDRYQLLKQQQTISAAVFDDADAVARQQAISLEQQRSKVENFRHRRRQALAQLDHALINVKKADLNLERTQINSPFSGFVSQLIVTRGDRVSTGSALLTLIDTRQLEIRAQIANHHVPALRKQLNAGRPVHASALLDNQIVELHLKQISAEVDRGQGGVEAIFSLIEQHSSVTLGTVVKLSLQLPSVENVVAVPMQSVYDNNRVYVIEQQRLRRITVEVVGESLGASGDIELLIRSSELKSGQQLMTSQLTQAITGLKVKAIEADKDQRSSAQHPTLAALDK